MEPISGAQERSRMYLGLVHETEAAKTVFFGFSLNFFHFIKQKFLFQYYILFGAQRI